MAPACFPFFSPVSSTFLGEWGSHVGPPSIGFPNAVYGHSSLKRTRWSFLFRINPRREFVKLASSAEQRLRPGTSHLNPNLVASNNDLLCDPREHL